MAAKLFYTATSCGAASFISAHTAGVQLETEQVDLATHTCPSGDFYKFNPKGNVPAIVLADGTVLNENAATLQYIADQAKTVKVAPEHGTSDRYLLQVALSYISSELHGTVGQLFNPTISAEVKDYILKRLATKLKYVDEQLIGSKNFVVGNFFTVADAYLYIVFTWFPYLQ
eukprot:Colp12_sorted_trinity150504_noHs@16848